MNNSYEVYTSTSKDDPVIEALLSNLNAYNYTHVKRDLLPFIVAFKTSHGLLGGAQCVSFGGWMHVKLLWVKESERKRGLGTRILDLVEQEAVQRKCIGIHLDTFSFQARDFYLKLGFEIFGQINDHPRGHSRVYYLKRIAS